MIENVADLKNYPRVLELHLLYGWFWDLTHDPRILGPVKQLLGPDVLMWMSNLIVKNPGDQNFYSYHQDSSYWGLEPHNVVTAWIALSDASPEAGPMSFVPGSHRKTYEHEDTVDPNNMLSRGQRIPGITEDDAILAPLKTGEMSLHHVGLVHGSNPNRSSDARIGLVLRLMASNVRQTLGEDTAVLMAGEDRYGHFELLPRPEQDAGDEEQKRQMHSISRKSAILLQEGTKLEQLMPNPISPGR
jgi:ectoine hydroxylase-related dioxygenase (phytanoyl-CoA dioxygenase family)